MRRHEARFPETRGGSIQEEITMKLSVVLIFAMAMGFGVLGQSADEAEYEKWMKMVGATVGPLRKNIEAKNAEETAKGAATLVECFKKSETFWAGRKKEDGVEWSRKSMTAAAEIEKAAKAGEFEKVGESAKTFFGSCAGCHTAYREKLPEGGYRFKQASQ
jgi:cytochrome c556